MLCFMPGRQGSGIPNKKRIRFAAAFHGRQALGTQAGNSGSVALELPLSSPPKILQQISRGNWCFSEAACCPDPHQLGCLQQSTDEVWRKPRMSWRANCRSLPCCNLGSQTPKPPDHLAGERRVPGSCKGKKDRTRIVPPDCTSWPAANVLPNRLIQPSQSPGLLLSLVLVESSQFHFLHSEPVSSRVEISNSSPCNKKPLGAHHWMGGFRLLRLNPWL
jgi:hypothetical protein